MAWLRAGTVAVTNGSTTVTGTGAGFAANTRVGDAFIGPDGRQYELQNVASDTVISILPAYLGPTASGQPYAVMPVQGYQKLLADLVRDWTGQYGQKMAALGTTGNYDILPIAKGGTGGTDQVSARAGLGLGTAATANITTSAIDSTAGRVLKVGDNGIGSRGEAINYLANANVPPPSGKARVQPETANGPGVFGTLEQSYFDTGSWTQTVTSIIDGTVFARAKASWLPSPTEWVRQTPERVNNSSGSAIKFPDGTMICWVESKTGRTTSNASGSVFVGTEETLTFPVPFAGPPTAIPAVAYSGGAYCWASVGSTSAQQVVVNGFSPFGSSTYLMRCIAIGNWK
nr:tail fiber protein [Pseudomonas sp. FFPRI_1]